jgi:4-amino-4-deoxy-L-arabinose transferase-like glycosyltransferase
VLAERLAAGDGFAFNRGHPTSWRAPLWPAVISVVYRVTGPSVAAARVLQGALGALLVLLIIGLSRAVAPDHETVPVVAGWWAALSPTLVFYSHCLFSETLFGLCLAAGLWSLLRGRRAGARGWWLLAGVCLGLACLVRGSTLLMVPLILLWLAWSRRRQRDWLGVALVVGLTCAVTVAPWSVRNRVTQGGWILVDSNGALNFYWGNHPHAPLVRTWNAVMHDRPEPAGVEGADPMTVQRAAISQALDFIRERPGKFALGLLAKSGNLWGLERGLPSGFTAGLYGPAGTAATALALLLAAGEGLALLVLAVVGMALAWDWERGRAAVLLQLAVVASLTVVHAVSFGHSRFRFGALPLCYAFAAVAVSRRPVWREAPISRRRAALVCAALLLANFLYEASLEAVTFLRR